MCAPYRRFSNPWVIAASGSSASTQIAIASDPKYPGIGQARSFEFKNMSPYYARLRGSSQQQNGGFVAVTDTTGHVIAPFETIIRSSQRPDWISVQFFDYAGFGVGNGRCEINYGTGGT